MKSMKLRLTITVLGCALAMSSHLSAQPTTTAKAAGPPAAQDGSDANSLKASAVEKLALQIMETPTYKAAVAKALKDFSDARVERVWFVHARPPQLEALVAWFG